ncbi:MAG: hypothetical protein LAN62_09895 [Acidobacteriia bacterium]|nr:hypothetical protein [Terriglobia bacterium]
MAKDTVLHGGSIYIDGRGNILTFPGGLTRTETLFIAHNVSRALNGEETEELFDAFVKFAASRGISLFEKDA